MKRFIYLSFLMIALFGCEKENTLAPLDGAYAGTFRIMANNNEYITDFEMILNRKRFTTVKGGTGYGPFELLSNNKVKFSDERIYTANLNMITLLSGEYNYIIKGDSLFLNKDLGNPVNGNYYQYRLKKIN